MLCLFSTSVLFPPVGKDSISSKSRQILYNYHSLHLYQVISAPPLSLSILVTFAICHWVCAAAGVGKSVASLIWFSCRSISTPGVLLFVRKARHYSLCVVFSRSHAHALSICSFLVLTWSQSGSLDLPSPPQISCHCYHTPLNFHEWLRWPEVKGPAVSSLV